MRASRGSIVISAGFKETGGGGEARGADPRACAPRQDAGHRPELPWRDEPAHGAERHLRGSDGASRATSAFISQSGALCTAVLDWSLQEMVGFSNFISIGSMVDVGWGDLIDYLGDDPRTRSIVIYMESIGDARLFLSAAREVALTKPIIVIKAGRHRGRRPRRRLAHGRADRQRRGARRGLPSQRRAAGEQHRRPVLHGRGALETAAAQGAAPDDRDQRRRPRRAGHRRR